MENQKKEKLSSGETKENDSCRQGAQHRKSCPESLCPRHGGEWVSGPARGLNDSRRGGDSPESLQFQKQSFWGMTTMSSDTTKVLFLPWLTWGWRMFCVCFLVHSL